MRPAQKIEVLFSDIDGTLTDGRLYYGKNGEELKVFHVKDGEGIKRWMNHGLIFGVTSARQSKIIEVRMKELGVEHVALNRGDKVSFLEEWLSANGQSWESLAYIGDDLNDMPVIEKCGLSAAPHDAANEVLNAVDYRCHRNGGTGAVREWIDYLLKNR